MDGTRSLLVTYRGRLIEAYYHSSSGGHTENNEDVWGGTPLPYLRGVCDPGDYTRANPNRAWQTTLSATTIGRRISDATGHWIGTARRFRHTIRLPGGRIDATTVVGSSGRVRVTGGTLAWALGLRDQKVWIDTNRTVRGPIRRKYDARGCAPGLPLSAPGAVPGGVRQRFVHGAMYRDSRNSVWWLYGPVYDAYRVRHESASILGMPRSSVQRVRASQGCARVHCRRALFEHGAIYWKPAVGLHVLYGRVFETFWTHGGAWVLGFPKTGVWRGPSGSMYTKFERGIVTCPLGGPCIVRTSH